MILDELAEYARRRVDEEKRICPPDKISEAARRAEKGNGAFMKALKKRDLSLICEIKKASPSKGVISEDFPYMDIAADYCAGGADCISVLTEPKWFLGSNRIFSDIRSAVKTPMLRKDFIVDEYQIYEAKLMGADAVLLICAVLDASTMERYLGICDELGLDALVEAHDEMEISAALSAGARIVGVNNRNLKDFTVDISNAARLREMIPPDVLYVAESGVKDESDVRNICEFGADGVLVGEALMRSENRRAVLRRFRDAARRGGRTV